METDIESRPYELGYHISPDLEEAELKARMGDVESIVTTSGGTVVISREPKRIHLSYPLSHKHYAYFGVIDFSAAPEAIDTIGAQLKLQNGILRFLVIKKPAAGKELRVLGDQRLRRGRGTTYQKSAADAHKPAKPAATPVEQEKMTKEIEDVLGKI